MANETLDLIKRHASVREFRPDPVPPSMVEEIISAAQHTSTSSNLQLWSVIAVTDLELKARLAELAANQAFIVSAPVFLIWYADLSRLDRVAELRGYTQVTEHVESFLVAAVDTAIAAQSAALAAESMDLGVCYVGAVRNQPAEIIAALGLPRLTFPIAGMALGYPIRRPLAKPRLPLRAVLHWQRYDGSGEDAALIAYDRIMAATGIYDGRQVPVPGKPGMTEDYGWLEHSARRASKAVRTHLRKVLEDQGFKLA